MCACVQGGMHELRDVAAPHDIESQWTHAITSAIAELQFDFFFLPMILCILIELFFPQS